VQWPVAICGSIVYSLSVCDKIDHGFLFKLRDRWKLGRE